MRHYLPLGALILLGCSPSEEARKAPTEIELQRLEAAARVDDALMAEYALVEEQRQRRNAPLPALPAVADDATFLRRASIDLAGRLPKAEEVRAFLADKTPDKRGRLTDALVKDESAGEMRFQMLAELFRVKGDEAVIGWLRQAAREDRPFDEVVSHMVGGGHVSRRDGGNPLRTGAAVAYAVLGADIHCALCHDDPFGHATQRQSYEFAACFADDDPPGEVKLPMRYLYRNGTPGEVVRPKLLPFTRDPVPAITVGKEARQQVVDWIVQEPSRRYAKVAAVRVWSGLFGMPGLFLNRTTGGCEEAPAWHDVHAKTLGWSNNCSGEGSRRRITWIHGDLNYDGGVNNAPKVTGTLTLLGDEFLRAGRRIGEFQRILARTEAYQRGGIDYNLNWDGCYFAPAPHVRRLPSEVILSALFAEAADQLPQVPPAGHPLRLLGRGTREWADESAAPLSHEIARFMINGELIRQRSSQATGTAEDLFLSLLGRNPSEQELASISRNNASPEDVAWALLNTKEFMFRF